MNQENLGACEGGKKLQGKEQKKESTNQPTDQLFTMLLKLLLPRTRYLPVLSGKLFRLSYSTATRTAPDAIIVGVYEPANGNEKCQLATASLSSFEPTVAKKVADATSAGRWGIKGTPGFVRVVHELGAGAANKVAIVGLGKRPASSPKSCPHAREVIRKAAALGAQALRDHGANSVLVDPMGFSHAAAEGAALGLYVFDELKAEKSRKPKIQISPLAEEDLVSGSLNWDTGLLYAQAQNFARRIVEMPSNLATPELISKTIASQFTDLKNVQVFVRDEKWIHDKKMRAFLSVAAGSAEKPRFIEIIYRGANGTSKPVVLVGKGVTFDSGGISIKPSSNMALMRGDKGGAGSVAAAMIGIARLGLPIDVVALLPMTENMPSGTATRPGDVVTASNGKTIEVDNTDAEGRLILADALVHACNEYKPSVVVDVATLTGAMMIALGDAYSGVFSTSNSLWKELADAGVSTGDRFWRMPFDDVYTQMTSKSVVADLINSAGRGAGACTAAAFLREFVSPLEPDLDQNSVDGVGNVRYAHIDIAGTMDSPGDSYHVKGMTGRPTRALIEFVRLQAGREVELK